MATIASLNVNMTANSAQLRQELDTVSARSRRFARGQQGIFTRLSRNINTLRFGFGAIAGLLAGGGFVRAADDFANINNQLRASGISVDQLGAAFERVQAIAVATRADLDTTARLVARLSRSADDLGISFSEVEVIARTINQAFVISGASVAEATNATRQLIQGLQSGTLRGDELRSVLEQAPIITELLNARLGTTTGQLRMLAEQGRVTSEVVVGALLAGAPQVNEQFSEIGLTFSQLGSVVQTQITPAIGRLAQQILPTVATVLTAIADVIDFLGNQLGAVNRVIIVLAAALGARLLLPAISALNVAFGALTAPVELFRAATARATVGLSMFTFGLSTAGVGIGRFTALIQLSNGTLVTYTGVLAGVAVALRGLRVAFAVLTGPLGIVISLLAVFAVDIFRFFVPAAESAEDSLSSLNEEIEIASTSFGDLSDSANRAASAFGFESSIEAAQRFQVQIGEISQAEFDRLQSLDMINVLLEDGLITIEQAREGVLQVNRAFEETMSGLSDVRDSIEDNIGDALVNAFERGRLSFRDLTRSILSDIIRIQLRRAATGITSSIFSSIIPGLQQGGPALAGQAYIVGEAGPELFVPNVNGNVVPNDRLGDVGGGGETVVNYNIQAVDARSFQQLAARDPEFIFNLSERGRRRQGRF